MASITLEDLALPGAVSLAAALQLTSFAKRVGQCRKTYKVPYPAISGNAAFERAFRAQQNTLEFAPIFYPCLWVSGIYFHPVPASLLGLGYIYARQNYFNGYLESVEGRLPGFKMGVNCLLGMLFMGIAGLSTTLLRKNTDIDLAQIFWSYAEKYLPIK